MNSTVLICQLYRPEAIKSPRPGSLFLIIPSSFSIFNTTTHEKPISGFFRGAKWLRSVSGRFTSGCRAGWGWQALGVGNRARPDPLGRCSFSDCFVPGAGDSGSLRTSGHSQCHRPPGFHKAQGMAAQPGGNSAGSEQEARPSCWVSTPETDGETPCPASLTVSGVGRTEASRHRRWRLQGQARPGVPGPRGHGGECFLYRAMKLWNQKPEPL